MPFRLAELAPQPERENHVTQQTYPVQFERSWRIVQLICPIDRCQLRNVGKRVTEPNLISSPAKEASIENDDLASNLRFTFSAKEYVPNN